MKRCSLLIAVILLLMCSSEALARRLPIEVQSEQRGAVAERLAYSLKEKIRASSFFDYTYDLKRPRFIIFLYAFDEDARKVCVYSATITWANPSSNSYPFSYPVFLNNSVGQCGENKIHEAVENIMAVIVRDLEPFLKSLENQKRRK